MSKSPLRVTIWNEFVHEKANPLVAANYPQGIHQVIAAALSRELGPTATIRTATLEEPEHGLTDKVLAETDVLLWWGHKAHDQVADAIVERVAKRVWQGMGYVPLHSSHASKLFCRLMGTSCMLRWREADEKERIWVVNPSHPIAEGIDGEFFELEKEEMYGEFFDIPPPDELIFLSWFQGGEVFRSGCTFRRGKGKIFYFRPGHETYPTYHHPTIQRIIANGVRWAAPTGAPYFGDGRQIVPALEAVPNPAHH
jgi:trehalose utilization protein